MFENHSPWIRQLNRTRPVATVEKIDNADIAIVGGGIAGVTTAYFLLKNTDKKVALLEADKIAHGATGHNAGQITGYFERPLKSIADEYGIDQAIAAQASIDGAWVLLEELMSEAKLQTPMSSFLKALGLTSVDQIMRLLKDNDIKAQGGLPVWPVLVKDDVVMPPEADEFTGLWKRAAGENILSLLETNDERYIAVGQERAGCMNSALFTEELIGYLLSEYADRFVLSERTPVIEIALTNVKAVLKIPQGDFDVENVILCTNGFKNVTLTNEGADIDLKFHHSVKGYVGYMAAYTDEERRPPTAVTYFDDPLSKMETDDSYFYLTRRPYEKRDDRGISLISVGGPGAWLDEAHSYSIKDMYPEDAQGKIDEFIKRTYNDVPKDAISYEFKWHGLMGFTTNNLRLIGREPCNPILLYNLGCNGVGILPSIFGADRIAKMIKGEEVALSVFDPKDQRCIVAPIKEEQEEGDATPALDKQD